MSEQRERRGTCLCGEVRLTAKAARHSVGACHCIMCRRWGGGPLLALDCGTDVELEGAENVSVFDSSEWADRGFCSKCGTHLFYRLKGAARYFVPAGLFADDADLTFDDEVFVDERPAWYRFANETNEMTASEVFAKYGAPE